MAIAVRSLDVHAPATLPRNVVALTSGLLLWTASHFGVIAVLPLYLQDRGYDGITLGVGLYQRLATTASPIDLSRRSRSRPVSRPS